VVSKRRLAFLVVLWLGGTGVAAAMPGCYGRNCEGDLQTWGLNAGEGRMLDDDMWESSPQNGKWLFFPRQRVWRFDLKTLGGRTPQIILPYVSANEEPNKTGQSATMGGGNLAEIYYVNPDTVSVKNGTCSDYYLRLVVVVEARPPETNTADAAVTDAMTDAADAANDASDSGPKDAGADGDSGN
jgi:hypothetical protein